MLSSFLPICFRRAGVAAACMLTLALAQAQATHGVDDAAWSGFLPSAGPAGGMPPPSDMRDIQREGPWHGRRVAALAPAEQRLMDALRAARWADALTLLQTSRPLLDRTDDRGDTALTLAARAGQLKLVRTLLQRGADPDHLGADGRSPLGAAAWYGQLTVARDLLRHGAQVNLADARGQTALHLACAAGHTQLVALLMDAGADWRWPDHAHHNALEAAARFGQVPVLQQLAKAGVPLDARDEDGLNAVHAAAEGDQAATVAWLRAQGVPVSSVLTQVLIDRIGHPTLIAP